MNILLTGITGFAGTNLVRYFGNRGDVNIFGHTRDIARASKVFTAGRVTFLSELSPSVFDENRIDAIVHLAGIAHDLSNQYKTEDYYRVNDLSTRQLYDSFLKSKAQCFVYVSSIKAVADVASAPVDETAEPNPSTDYGRSKLQAEQYILANKMEGKRVYIVRPCMIHGPGNKGNLNLLYNFVKKGLPYPLGAFENRRSFLSVDNFTFIIDQLIHREISPGVYHLADEGFLPTTRLVEVIGLALNKKVKILNIPRSFITFGFTLIGKRRMLTKLSEDMMVSNTKLLNALNGQLPVKLEQGVINTIRSFHES